MKTLHWLVLLPIGLASLHLGGMSFAQSAGGSDDRVDIVLARLRAHAFHPVREGMTFDRTLDQRGVANLADDDWRVRTLAVRDLIRLGPPSAPALIRALNDPNPHLRQVSAMVLGILQIAASAAPLAARLESDDDWVVRSQAAVALGQIGEASLLLALKKGLASDPSRDVQHQCELAIYALERGIHPSPEFAAAYAALDESRFDQVRVGATAPDFALPDTEGRVWRLADFRGKSDVLLIWVFADWCPVCHHEFHDLIALKDEFARQGVQVFTIECHDTFPARVMVGKELEPHYWFSKSSFKKDYTEKIWWPHLVDRAGAVGATYGVQPMAFVVHSEWINRPATVIVDKDGVVRFAYAGTFWGDRPSIKETIDLLRSRHFAYTNPKRLPHPANAGSARRE
ncbi:MAG: HEAT repeat domain-containing protein [Verrucomicrobia bacterium]|nr:HEAT repeat domain-containing protein [Verrucomicrobiota bacterium]